MKVWVLGSGSRGNAVLLECSGSRVMIDAGFHAAVLARRLETIGVAPESIEAVVVTHEHNDHARGAAACAEKWGWRVLATAGTRMAHPELRFSTTETIGSSGSFMLGGFEITTVPTSHDAAEPVGIVAQSRSTGTRTAVVYDLGMASTAVRDTIRRVDMLLLESNHDETMLQRGPYPASVRARIAGRSGHLSNRAAAAVACDVAHRGLKHVVLSHLSERCNLPETATTTVRAALARTQFRGNVWAASQDAPIGPFMATSATGAAAAQLTLGL